MNNDVSKKGVAELSTDDSANGVSASPKWFRNTDELNKELDAIKLDFTNKINAVREKYLINGYGLIVVAGSPSGKSEISFVIDMGSVKV